MVDVKPECILLQKKISDAHKIKDIQEQVSEISTLADELVILTFISDAINEKEQDKEFIKLAAEILYKERYKRAGRRPGSKNKLGRNGEDRAKIGEGYIELRESGITELEAMEIIGNRYNCQETLIRDCAAEYRAKTLHENLLKKHKNKLTKGGAEKYPITPEESQYVIVSIRNIEAIGRHYKVGKAALDELKKTPTKNKYIRKEIEALTANVTTLKNSRESLIQNLIPLARSGNLRSALMAEYVHSITKLCHG